MRPKHPPGFTLLELMLVVSIVSIIAGMVAPSLTHLGKRSMLRGNAHALVGAISAARAYAVNTGKCVVVAIDDSDPLRLVVAESPSPINCEQDATVSGGVISLGGTTLTTNNKLTFTLAKTDGVKIKSADQADISGTQDVVVWRSNGYLRGGTEFGTNTTINFDDNRLTYTLESTASMPSSLKEMQVQVTAVGLTCVVEEGACQ